MRKLALLLSKMAPRIKENSSVHNSSDLGDSGSDQNNDDFNILKSFFHFSMQQVISDHKDREFRDLFSRRRSKDSPTKESTPAIDNQERSDSTEERSGDSDKNDNPLKDNGAHVSRRWRRPSLGIARTTFGRRRRSTSRAEQKRTKFPPDKLVEEPNENTDRSSQQILALSALDLTAPICPSALKERKFIQLTGHPGSLAPAGANTIWKKQNADANEAWVYGALMKDIAKDIVPKFYKEIEYDGERFIEISDLLSGFVNPSLMDIKMGCRTFLESEAANKRARNDLYEKMILVDKYAPTTEEHQAKAVTKLRYMNFRDTMSSSRELGFRIDALKMGDNHGVTELKKLKERDDVVEALFTFIQGRESTKRHIIRHLCKIRSRFEESKFFKKHEVIGSSILIVYDDHKASAWMIDFAKTNPLPSNIKVDHRRKWSMGNHEEGYLLGLDNLISCFQSVPLAGRRARDRRLSFFKRF